MDGGGGGAWAVGRNMTVAVAVKVKGSETSDEANSPSSSTFRKPSPLLGADWKSQATLGSGKVVQGRQGREGATRDSPVLSAGAEA